MPVDFEPKDLGPVVQLVANSNGWAKHETTYILDQDQYVGGDITRALSDGTPEGLSQPLRAAWLTTKEQRPTDFNGPKVAIARIALSEDNRLYTEGITTDYFTLWGIPKTEVARDLFNRHERQIVINQLKKPVLGLRAVYATDLPWGACTHNTLLDRNGDVLMMVRSQSQGFNAGRVSVTEEEQTEPTDSSIFTTSARSFKEELNLEIPQRRVMLLGVAMEKGAAYAAFAYITETNVLAADLVKKWQRARDYNENTALFAVPMTQVKKWALADEVTPDIWNKNLLAGNVAPDAKLKLHATSAWRINLAREYASLAV